jgi:protein-disulfide isomerase
MRIRTAIGAAIVFALISPGASAQDQRAQVEAIVKDYLASHPEELGEIVKGYFVKHPEAVGQILAEIIKRRPGAAGMAASGAVVDRATVIAGQSAALFDSPHQVTLGEPRSDVTLVEFFDYNCGYCRRALGDTLQLLKDDLRLKIVLKEFPVLGPGSAAAARVAIAVRMQEPAKYLEFHQALLRASGPVSEAKAIDVARGLGFDMDRLAGDMASQEAAATIDETVKLGKVLGVTGTPTYVVGGKVLAGAVGLLALKAQIAEARAARPH